MSSRFPRSSIAFAVFLLVPPTIGLAQVSPWRIAVPQGGMETAAVRLTNNCERPHRFRVAAARRSLAEAWDADFVAFDARLEETPVEPKSAFEAPFTVDARSLEPGTYVREVRVYCLDCATEPDCRPATSGNTLEIEVVEATSIPRRNSTIPTASASVDHLKNRDVVQLADAGLGEEVILAKIRASKTDFDTSPEALTELKAAGVPDAVILEMVENPGGLEAELPKEDPSHGRTGVARWSRVFIAPMEGHLDGFLAAELVKNEIPLTIVVEEGSADFIMAGLSIEGDSKWYNTVFGGKDKHEGSVRLISVSDRTVVWAGEGGD